jgi:hypothetical protein
MIKCDKCKSNFLIGNRADGTPNGVGFQLQDGRIINLCADCINEIGRLKEAGEEKKIKKFFEDMGVETNI